MSTDYRGRPKSPGMSPGEDVFNPEQQVHQAANPFALEWENRYTRDLCDYSQKVLRKSLVHGNNEEVTGARGKGEKQQHSIFPNNLFGVTNNRAIKLFPNSRNVSELKYVNVMDDPGVGPWTSQNTFSELKAVPIFAPKLRLGTYR